MDSCFWVQEVGCVETCAVSPYGFLLYYDPPGNFSGDDTFAEEVGISGSFAVVGSPQGSTNDGELTIFERVGASWVFHDELYASDAAGFDYFGNSVDIDGDYIVVGAPRNDDDGGSSGAAYIFHYDSATWSEQDKMTALDAGAGDQFGAAVAISGDYCVIGAPYDDDTVADSGAAYVFHRSGTVWSQVSKLKSNSPESFGEFGGLRVAIDGDYIIVGAHREDNGAGANSGAAYIFNRTGGTNWAYQDTLTPSDAAAEHWFGYDVAIRGDLAVVAARGDSGNSYAYSGVYVFERSGSSWVEIFKLTPDPVAHDQHNFESCAITADGERIYAGGRRDAIDTHYQFSAYHKQGLAWLFAEVFLTPPEYIAVPSEPDRMGGRLAVDGNNILAGARNSADFSNNSAVTFWEHS